MAPRIHGRLVGAILRLDDPGRPIAETYRLVGAEAERLGLTRPSYQRIRELVHASRNRRPRLSALDVLTLLTTLPKGVDDGLQRMELLGLHGIAEWAGLPDPRLPRS